MGDQSFQKQVLVFIPACTAVFVKKLEVFDASFSYDVCTHHAFIGAGNIYYFLLRHIICLHASPGLCFDHLSDTAISV